MNRLLVRALYFLLGLIGLISLLCSVAAASVTNEAQITSGFQQYARTVELGVLPSRYGDYAKAITRYLDGRADGVTVPDPETGAETPAFSDKENAHLADVRRIVGALKWVRWIGGGGVLTALAALYLTAKDKSRVLSCAVRGFALAALCLLLVATGLIIWGAVNFDGLFWTFHQVAFTNNMWLLNPRTDLLMALMPLSFFTWYAGEMLKSMLPILGVMALVIIAWLRIGKTQKEVP